MADKSKIMADIKKLGPVNRMSPVKKKRYDKLMKFYQTLSKQDKNKAESIKNIGRTSANDTEDKRIVGKNDKGEKVVKGTVMGNLKSNEAARNAKVEKPKVSTTSYKSTHLGLGYGASHTGYTRSSYQNQMEFDNESGWYKNKKIE